MQVLSVTIQYQSYTKGSELNEMQLRLLQSAQVAALDAYAPYSKFQVGAAILLHDDIIITGCNQENASYPCGICAERVSLFNYGSIKNKVGISKMAVSAIMNHDKKQLPAAPCGLCRQVMSEFENLNNSEIELIIGHQNTTTYVFTSIQSLLPMHFHKGYLTNE